MHIGYSLMIQPLLRLPLPDDFDLKIYAGS